MYEIMDWIIKYQKTKEENDLGRIVKRLEPLIYSTSLKVAAPYREDLIQELKMGIVNIIQTFKVSKKELDVSLFCYNNLFLLEEQHFSSKSIYSLFSDSYFISFLREFGLEKFKISFICLKKRTNLIANFSKFNAQNQFFSILQKRFSSILSGFYRKNSKSFFSEIRSLNTINDKGRERIEEIEAPSLKRVSLLDQLDFSINDINFLKLFIEDNNLLTQLEVANKLGVSQQYVSKKLKEIKVKYKNKL